MVTKIWGRFPGLTGEIGAGGLQPHIVGERISVTLTLTARVPDTIDNLVRFGQGVEVGLQPCVGFQIQRSREPERAVTVLDEPQLRPSVLRVFVAGLFAVGVHRVQHPAPSLDDLLRPSPASEIDQDLLPDPHVLGGHKRRDLSESADDRVDLTAPDRALRGSFGGQGRQRWHDVSADDHPRMQSQRPISTSRRFLLRHMEILRDQAHQRRMPRASTNPARIQLRQDRVLLRIQPTFQYFDFLLSGMQRCSIGTPPLGAR